MKKRIDELNKYQLKDIKDAIRENTADWWILRAYDISPALLDNIKNRTMNKRRGLNG